jgi:N-acetylglutamate synthase/N-acetylornithine aminotransferase
MQLRHENGLLTTNDTSNLSPTGLSRSEQMEQQKQKLKQFRELLHDKTVATMLPHRKQGTIQSSHS